MNILPQKSWHVRRKENVEKVRRDEAEAESRRLELEKRHSRAETEALRQRLGKGDAKSSEMSGASGHLNLFWDRDIDNSELNKADHREEDKKRETEEWARKVGISVGLNDKSEEAEAHWVFGNKSKNVSSRTAVEKKSLVQEVAEQKRLERDREQKNREDPMSAFKQQNHLSSSDQSKSNYSSSAAYSAELAFDTLQSKEKLQQLERDKEQKKRTKKEKRRKTKRKKNRTSSSDSSSSEREGDTIVDKKKAKLDQLRKERLVREEKERKRAELLLKEKLGRH